MEDRQECDFIFEDTDDSTNVWRCRACRVVVRQLGDGCPPNKVCDMNPASRPLTAGEISLDMLHTLRKEYPSVRGVAFGDFVRPLATWAEGNGLDVRAEAYKRLAELQAHVAASPSGQRVYKIPYCAYVGEEVVSGEHSRILEADIHPTT
jgi:hypothetical protein